MKKKAGAVLTLLFCSVSLLPAQVTYERLLNAEKEPQNWLTYSGTYSSHRYSELSHITTANVKDLELKSKVIQIYIWYLLQVLQELEN